VTHQIAKEPAVLMDLLGACTVRDASGLHDRGVVAHVIKYTDEAIVEHFERPAEYRVERRHLRTRDLLRYGAIAWTNIRTWVGRE